MGHRIVTVRNKEIATTYTVRIANGIRHSAGRILRQAIGDVGRRAIIVSNRKIFGLYGEDVRCSLISAGFVVDSTLIGDGERKKNFGTLEKLLVSFSSFGITRGDAVVALGGGVVGDVAGLAASLHLRGVSYVQIPTTLLSMIDSSVGGKTGVNTIHGKNLVGTFYHPKAVLIDPEVLSTLPRREVTAGLCEAVKQGTVSGKRLFGETVSIVEKLAGTTMRAKLCEAQFCADLYDLLSQQIEFKASIVLGDEREAAGRVGSHSRKILNFGHTFAHALESATDYKLLKHGEAVGHGIIFSTVLSKKIGILSESVINLLCGVVRRTGSLPPVGGVDSKRILKAITHDKKFIGESLQWVLLKGIGKPVILPHEKIGDDVVRETIAEFTSQ